MSADSVGPQAQAAGERDVGWLDANVILRFLLGDHPEQSRRAAALIQRAEAGQLTLMVTHHILCEVVYVLEGQGHDKDGVAQALTRFCLIKGLEIAGDRDVVLTALLLYRQHGVDFADALLHSIAADRGGTVWTYNRRHFRRMGEGCQEPC